MPLQCTVCCVRLSHTVGSCVPTTQLTQQSLILLHPVALAAHASVKAQSKKKTKSSENKALHDAQRLASSNANFARSRTVTDKTCGFPSNFLGRDIGEYAGSVKYIADEKAIECKGTAPGLCAGDMNATKYTTRK